MSSYDILRVFKRNLGKQLGKIGHFGTLDPFASGVLLIGIRGGAKLNDFVHMYEPKTYLAGGRLGVQTNTGDHTGEVTQTDDSAYTKEIASLSIEFIQEKLQEKFLGSYMQAPHTFSAAKHEGKALHQWAREGVEIKKEKKERFIYELEVVSFNYPHLNIRYKVSSGTYIRTLFSDCANYLGTLGSLDTLDREAVGNITTQTALVETSWPDSKDWDIIENSYPVDEILKLPAIKFEEKEARLYSNGVALKVDRAISIEEADREHYWVYDQNEQLLGMSYIEEGLIRTQFNLASSV